MKRGDLLLMNGLVLVILFAVVVYQNQEDLMGKIGLLSQEKICLTAKVRLKNACCETSKSWSTQLIESESGVKGMTIPEGKHCHYTTARKTIKAGGCHLHGTLTDEEYEKAKALLWTSGACSK